MTSVYIFAQMNISICDHTKLSPQPYEYIWHFYVGLCQIYVLYGLCVCVKGSELEVLWMFYRIFDNNLFAAFVTNPHCILLHRTVIYHSFIHSLWMVWIDVHFMHLCIIKPAYVLGKDDQKNIKGIIFV